PTRCCARATTPRPCWSSSSPRTSGRACSAPCRSGRGWTSPALRCSSSSWTASLSPAPTTRCPRRGRGRWRRAAATASWPSRRRTRRCCWRRAPGGSCVRWTTGAWSPSSTRAWRRRATAASSRTRCHRSGRRPIRTSSAAPYAAWTPPPPPDAGVRCRTAQRPAVTPQHSEDAGALPSDREAMPRSHGHGTSRRAGVVGRYPTDSAAVGVEELADAADGLFQVVGVLEGDDAEVVGVRPVEAGPLDDEELLLFEEVEGEAHVVLDGVHLRVEAGEHVHGALGFDAAHAR